MATIIVGPPMGSGRRRTWTTWRVAAQQFLDRQGIGVLIRWYSAMRVKRDAGHLWRQRVICLKMFLEHDEAPFGLRVVIGTHVINAGDPPRG